MSLSQDANKRVKKLFSDIKSIADQSVAESTRALNTNKFEVQPQADVQQYQREIEALQARVCELEASLAEAKEPRKETASRVAESVSGLKRDSNSSTPLLYEKEQVGYVFSDDKLTPVELVSATLPDADKAISAPLVASGQIIGEMQIHPSAERMMTAEDENLASAVA